MKSEMIVPPDKVTPPAQDHDHLVKRHLGEKLVKELGGRHSATLNISLDSMKSGEIFKWFLASILLGTEVDETIAINTYKEFEKANVLSPEAILQTGRQGLIDILNLGGYEGSQSRIASELLGTARNLMAKYDGDLNRLHFFAEDESDLVRKLKGLKRGIGPVRMSIFLTELRDIWEKAEPLLLAPAPAFVAAKHLGMTQRADASVAPGELRILWEEGEQNELEFSNVEVALLRLGRDYCLNMGCSLCPMSVECKSTDG